MESVESTVSQLKDAASTASTKAQDAKGSLQQAKDTIKTLQGELRNFFWVAYLNPGCA